MNLSSKTALVFDGGGLFTHIAEKLAESYGTVWLFIPWSSGGFPTAKRRMVGQGLPGVTRVYSWLNYIAEADVIVFPDVYNADESQFCRDMDRPVWGGGNAEGLEIQRWETREIMKSLDMPVIPAKRIIGVDALREHLSDKENLWIKRSIIRGDGETRHHVNAKVTEPWLTHQEHILGPRATEIEFVVEEDVPGKETGYDGPFVDGEYGAIGAYGWEKKDRLYILKVCANEDLPEPIKQVNDAFAPAMKQLGYRGFYSNEIRIADDGTPYLIDPTMRAGRPPSECYMEVFSNWAEVIYYGARGYRVDLKPVAKYAAEVVLKSDWVRENYLMVDYPDDIAQWIKIGNKCVIDGQVYVVPQDDPEFGSAVGIGDTPEEAAEMAEKMAEQVEAIDVDYLHGVWDCARKMIEDGSEIGIDF
jgi:hypothetical protein